MKPNSHNLHSDIEGRRIALLLEYDGTSYHGFQYQRNVNSIQNELETAIVRLTDENIRIKAAGRTDAGVHATGQVVCFDTYSCHPASIFVHGLNHYLPEDIVVKDARDVDLDFDPRRSAISRKYIYRVLNTKTPSPLLRGLVHLVKRELDLDAMRNAAKSLEGTLDCKPFSGPLGSRKTTIRTIYNCNIETQGDIVALVIEASGFLHQQVRRTMGALIEVGLGNMTVSEFQSLSKLGEARGVIPAKGLSLVEVKYSENIFNSNIKTEEHNVQEVGNLI